MINQTPPSLCEDPLACQVLESPKRTRKPQKPGCAERGVDRDPRTCGLLSVALSEDLESLAHSLQKFLAGGGPIAALSVAVRGNGDWVMVQLPVSSGEATRKRDEALWKEFSEHTHPNRIFQMKPRGWRGMVMPFCWDTGEQALVAYWRTNSCPAFTPPDKERFRRMREILSRTLRRFIPVATTPTRPVREHESIDALPLKPGEKECVRLAIEGWTNREIGDTTGQSEASVKFLLYGVYRKLGIRNRAQLASRLA